MEFKNLLRAVCVSLPIVLSLSSADAAFWPDQKTPPKANINATPPVVKLPPAQVAEVPGAPKVETPVERPFVAQAFGDLVYNFANGQSATIVTTGENQGLYWGKGLAAKDALLLAGTVNETSGGVERVSANAVPKVLLQQQLDAFDKKAMLLYVNRVPFIVNQQGVITELPVLAAAGADATESVFWNHIGRLTAYGHRYLAFRYVWKNSIKVGESKLNGEYYLIRDDGLFTRVAMSLLEDDELELKLDADILTFGEYSRKIDLKAFPMECSFNARIHTSATDSSGDKEVNAMAKVTSLFPEVTRSARPTPLNEASRDIISRTVKALTTMGKSAVILGESGSGKTALAEIVVNYLPRTWLMLKLTPESINSSARWTGNFDARLLAMKTVSEYRPVIWFADEVHIYRGLGTYQNQEHDIFEKLKSNMANGSMRWLGTSTPPEFSKSIGEDPALLRRFEQVKHEGYSAQEVVEIQNRWLREARRVRPSDEIMNEISLQAKRFDSSTAEPGRSLNLLKGIYADLDAAGKTELGRPELMASLQKQYNIPPAFVNFGAALKKLDELKDELHRRLPGNDEAKNKLFNAAAITFFGMQGPDRPRAIGAFAGPKGVGKSALVANYADIVGLPFLKIEMSQFGGPYDTPRFMSLFGAFMRSYPFGVVLFDEPDKASREVQDSLLGALESIQFSYQELEGDGNQRAHVVNVSNAQFFFATNAGKALVLEAAARGGSVSDEALTVSLQGELSEYVLDRLDFVAAMYPATPDVYRSILEKEFRLALTESHMVESQILNWNDMINSFAAGHTATGSNRQARRSSTLIRNAAVGLLRNRGIQSMAELQNVKLVFDVSTKTLLPAGESDCELILKSVRSTVVPFRP